MYSVVMAAMLTAGAGSTGFGHGCTGCHGYHGGLFSHHRACHGCSGCYCSGYGGSGYGGYGCYGCYGAGSFCSGCYGTVGCGGFGCYGCYGCYGCAGCYGCSGCCGGAVVYSGCSGCCGGVYAAPTAPAQPAPKTKKGGEAPQTQLEVTRPQVARITVKLPSNAKLWVDDVNCPLTSSERSFNTPPLAPGRQYFYTIRMEVERDGQTVSEDRRVFVAAGRQVNVDFNTPATVTAQR
jgi:uncharacterized protein (TIGR03000 family)